MTVVDERESARGRARFCPHCGNASDGEPYCRACGYLVDGAHDGPDAGTAEVPNGTFPPPGPVAHDGPLPGGRSLEDPPSSAPRPRRRVWIAAAALLCLAAIGVAAAVILSSGSSDQGAAYRHKLATALAPVVSANTGLSGALGSLQGSKTGAAMSAVTQAQQATVAARGAVGILTVPNGSAQLSQQVQQALTDEDGYLQAVSQDLSNPSSQNSSQLEPLATSLQSALVPLGSIAAGASTSVSGADKLGAWASGRAAAAAKASAAQQKASQQQAVQQAATKAAQQAVANNPGSLPSPNTSGGSVYGLGALPVQCGYGVAASAGMSCTFANNAFYEYWFASGGIAGPSEYISAWSTEGQTYFPLSCNSGDGVVDCTGTNNSGALLDARFTVDAVSAYSQSQANAYLATGKPGPNG